MLRITILLFSLLAIIGTGQSQRASKWGYTVPVGGDYDTIKVLLVFAEVDSTPCGKNNNPTTEWPDHQLPVQADAFYDPFTTVTGFPLGTNTKYLFEASFGRYVVLGDYVDRVITVKCKNEPPDWRTSDVLDTLDALYDSNDLTFAGGSVLSDFDRWTTGFNYTGLSKPNSGDGKADVVIVLWRNSVACGGGQGVGPQLTTHSFATFSGCNNASSFGACNAAGQNLTWEYFHAMMGGNNWHTPSGAGSHTFITGPSSWSLTAQSGTTSDLFCAWDRYHLSWWNPDNPQDTLMAWTPGDTAAISDLTIASGLPANGEFLLRDYATTGDAIRVKLPHLNWQSLGDVKNQYLWLENHQRLSQYDVNFGCDKWVPGLYAYILVGKDHRTGTSTQLFPSEGSSGNQYPNGLGSWLFPIPAEGRHDYYYNLEDTFYCQWYVGCCWGNNVLPLETDHPNVKPNPFTGFHDQHDTYDSDRDGILDPGNGYDKDRWGLHLAETKDDSVVYNVNGWGDDQDAFTLSGNRKLSIATNPAPFAVYTYRSNGYPNVINGEPDLDPWESRTIYLSGLSIEILDTITNTTIGGHDIKVRVRWDDYLVDNNTRWCGNIVLQNDALDPEERTAQIIVDTGKVITLDRGTSATQHVDVYDPVLDDDYFSQPTVLRLKAGTITTLRPSACLVIKNNSTLIVEAGAEVILEENALIQVDPTCWLIIEGGSNVEVGNSARIVIKGDASAVIESGASVTLEDDAAIVVDVQGLVSIKDNNVLTSEGADSRIELYGTIETDDEVDLSLPGPGYFKFYEGAQVNIGEGGGLILEYTDQYHRKAHFAEFADIAVDVPVLISSAQVIFERGGQLRATNHDFYCASANLLGQGTFGGAGGGGLVVQNSPYVHMIYNTFDNLDTALTIVGADTTTWTSPFFILSCTFTGNEHYAVKLDTVWRKVYMSSTTINASSGYSYGIFAVGCPLIHLNGTTVMNSSESGIYLDNVTSFVLDDNSIVENNNCGIKGYESNVFLRNGAEVRTNYAVGIDMYGKSVDGNLLVIGDQGCASVINHSYEDAIGVRGEDIILHADATIHSMDNYMDALGSQYNTFTNNWKVFDLCYKTVPIGFIDTIYLRGNFWGIDPGPPIRALSLQDVNYSITYSTGPVGPQCNNDVVVIDSPWHGLTFGFYDCTPFHDSIGDPSSSTTGGGDYSCYRIQGSGGDSLGNTFRDGYVSYLLGNYEEALSSFQDVVDIEPEDAPDFHCICTHPVAVARVLVDVLQAHVDYDSLSEEQGKRSRLPSRTEARLSEFLVPNPTRDELRVVLPADESVLITVTDISGRQVMARSVTGGSRVDVSSLRSGIYLARGRTASGRVMVQKVMIE